MLADKRERRAAPAFRANLLVYQNEQTTSDSAFSRRVRAAVVTHKVSPSSFQLQASHHGLHASPLNRATYHRAWGGAEKLMGIISEEILFHCKRQKTGCFFCFAKYRLGGIPVKCRQRGKDSISAFSKNARVSAIQDKSMHKKSHRARFTCTVAVARKRCLRIFLVAKKSGLRLVTLLNIVSSFGVPSTGINKEFFGGL